MQGIIKHRSSSACCLWRLPCDSCSFCIAPCPTVGLKRTMKLWDSMTTCLILLSAVHASSLPRSRQPSASTKRRERAADGLLDLLSVTSTGISRAEADPAGREEAMTGAGKYTIKEPPLKFQDVINFIKVTISRVQRSSSSNMSSSTTSFPSKQNLSSRTRQRREKKKGASQQSGKGGTGGARKGEAGSKMRGGRGNVRGRGCVLKQIHLNVSDLGLGYRSGEEMIFRYCSGPCRKSMTNYDKILYNLVHNRRLPPRDTPPQACCRPIAFDDDLSFLDDNLVYHTVRKHSARKCGCV